MKLSQGDDMYSVLVVDDDPDSRYPLVQYLSKSGFRVRSAPNGQQALLAVTTAVPDAIVLDVMMPEMTGVEFLQVLRSYLRWGTIPVILLTAYPEGPHIERAKELGVKCMFTKAGYQLADVVECIRRVVVDPGASCAG